MASVFAEAFEGASAGTTISTSNTTFGSVTGTACTFSTSSAAEGTRSASISTSSASTVLQKDHTAKASVWYVFRVRMTALPAAITYIASMFVGTSTKVADVRINTDGTVTVRDNVTASVTSTGTALTTNTWHRIAVRLTPGGGGTGIALKVYLGNGAVAPNFSGTGTLTGTGTLDRARFGVVTSATFAYLLDDIEVDDAVEPDGYSPPVSTELFEEDFEGGTNGAALTTSNTTAASFLGTVPTFTTTHHGTGALGVQVSTSVTSSAVQFDHDATETAWYVWRVRIPTLPETSTYLMSALTATTKVADLRINTDGTVTVRDNNSIAITSTVALTTGTWHRLALYVEPGVGLTLKVYLGDAVDADYQGIGSSSVAGDLERARFGVVASGTLTYQLDSIAADSEDEPDGGDAPTPPVSTGLITELFEGGSNGATITTGNTSASGVSGGPTFATAAAVQGGLGAHFAPSATVSYIQFSHTAAGSPWYSFYIKLATLPAVATYIGIWRKNTGVDKIADLRIDTNGALVLRDNVSTAVASTALLTVGHWHRVSVQVTPGTSLRMRVYLGPNRHNTSPSFEGTGGSSVSGDVDWFRIGVTTSSTWTLDVDRIYANTATEPDGLPPVDTPVAYYEHPTSGWVDVTAAMYYERPSGWVLIDPNY